VLRPGLAGMAGRVEVSLGEAWQGMAGRASFGGVRRCSAGLGMVGEAGSVVSGLGLVRSAKAWYGRLVRARRVEAGSGVLG
jgi:hypothetical protein